MSFYSKPFTKLLADKSLTAQDKLVLLCIESWHSYYIKNLPDDICTVYVNQLCKQLSIEINELKAALVRLETQGYLLSYPETQQKGSMKIIVTELDPNGEIK
ncbi:TPA: hypothetical protein LR286_003258 [Enterobacter hormaechei]|nr:hypothetical protein [Enterobacter hormaechei]HBL9125590.1 hypothetical protein [Enterobacter hormaechei]HCC6647859.1 hypothetical protein [Enterobacter hormaechei]